YHISGSRLLFLALMHRIEHFLAGLVLPVCSWVIKLGRVRLDFLPGSIKPSVYFRDMWLEDFNLMVTARMRSRFVLMRFVDAFGIVCDYGILARVYAGYLALSRFLGLNKGSRH
nr:hypothetical protein [Granulosicoccus sp.]